MNKSMIADTNILIQLFTKDDEVQVEQLVQIMERGDITFFILSIVLIETYWVLRRFYKVEKCEILHAFEEFIESDGVELEEENLIQRVLNCFREVNVDFIDVYIAEKSRSLGLSVLTWNLKDFRRLDREFFRPQDI